MTYPSAQPYGIVARHSGKVNLLFLAGQAQSVAGSFAGCGAGDPGRDDIRWLQSARPATPWRTIIEPMKRTAALLFLLVLAVTLAVHRRNPAANSAQNHVVRCAVIGGMTMTGLWPEISRMFEARTGYHAEVVVTGERPLLDKAIRAGQVDLLTMHSGDITTDIEADGVAVNMRPWTRNELVIVGPTNDPAGIRGMTNGVDGVP